MKKINLNSKNYTTPYEKIEILEQMHSTMIDMNNEETYFSWIYVVPDEPTKEDIEDIASDQDSFNYTVKAFNRLFNAYADDGLFRPTTKTMKLITDNNIDIDIFK